MLERWQLCGIALVFALSGCSSSPGESGTTVSGTLGGSAFVPMDAIGLVQQDGARVILTSTPDACTDAHDNVERANAQYIEIILDDTNAHDASLARGTYSTSDTATLQATFESNATDAQCNVSYAPSPDGTGDGTITVSSVTGTILSGSFDVTMEDGAHVTGTFDPTACPDLANRSPTPTCAP